MSEWSGTLYGLGLCGRSVLDVADQGRGISPLTESITVGDKGVSDCGKLPLGAEAAGTDAFEHRSNTSPLRNEQSSDSQIFDRHGDDRFADNILRACRNLPQHGDDEEERDAAEEGALIEASGYQFPEYERNGR